MSIFGPLVEPGIDQTVDSTCILTSGEFLTEEDSVARLHSILSDSGLFKIFREVGGYYTQPREGQDRKDPRIDLIVGPKPELLALGWNYGFVGIECKKSGVKANNAIAQMLDYQRAVWTLPKGYKIVLSHCFLWPLEKQHGVISSIFAQQKLGSAFTTNFYDLVLATGEVVIFRYGHSGAEVCQRNVGNRAGSR